MPIEAEEHVEGRNGDPGLTAPCPWRVECESHHQHRSPGRLALELALHGVGGGEGLFLWVTRVHHLSHVVLERLTAGTFFERHIIEMRLVGLSYLGTLLRPSRP